MSCNLPDLSIDLSLPIPFPPIAIPPIPIPNWSVIPFPDLGLDGGMFPDLSISTAIPLPSIAIPSIPLGFLVLPIPTMDLNVPGFPSIYPDLEIPFFSLPPFPSTPSLPTWTIPMPPCPLD